MKGRVFVSKLFSQISIISLKFYQVIPHISIDLVFVMSSSFCCNV